MTPTEKKNWVLAHPSGLPDRLVQEHARRLDADYFNEFSTDEIQGHLEQIAALQGKGDFHLEIKPIGESGCALTFIGEDLPGFFAVLSGLLASFDMDIRLGKVFSYREENPSKSSGSENRFSGEDASIGTSGKIIDFLVLDLGPGQVFSEPLATGIRVELSRLLGLLRNHESEALRRDLFMRIGNYLSRRGFPGETSALPLEIQVENDETYTMITVRGTDRKALLFSLSNALMLQGISIQKLLTQTEGRNFVDRIFVTDSMARPITDIAALERMKVAIVLMERFMTTLPLATDFPTAVQSFNEFIDALMERSGGHPDLKAYEDFSLLSALAKILSSGPYLWEELIRFPIHSLTQLLRNLDEERRRRPLRTEMDDAVRNLLAAEEDYTGKRKALNEYKDFQLFRMEVFYLVFPRQTLQEFSSELSDLADSVLGAAMHLAYVQLAQAYGEPRESPGAALPCRHGLFALGKMGGRELGYASDMELQLLFSSGGDTQGGPQSITHGEFFSLLAQEIREIVVARREGIFAMDWRLRPHGDSGPMATRLEVWREYYGPRGGARDYERQALLKMRPVYTIGEFGESVMAARNDLLFGSEPIAISDTLLLRAKQMTLKSVPLKSDVKTGDSEVVNAKYSAGGLVEIEYAVQFLQLKHGRRVPALRIPNTEEALETLLEAGALDADEFETLYQGYIFLRRLIDALRMTRGFSRDLFVPARGTDAFLFLAKRMGYLATPRFAPEDQLDWDLKKTLSDVHEFFTRRFLDASTVHTDSGTPRTKIKSLTKACLDPDSTEEEFQAAMDRLGLGAVSSIRALMNGALSPVKDKGILCACLVVAEAKIRNSADPEAVLRRLGQYLAAHPDADHFVRQALNHPYLLDILIKAFSHSEFLTQILLREPDLLADLGDPSALNKPKLLAEFHREILEMSPGLSGFTGGMEALRRYRNREYLRIGLRDIYLCEHLQKITAEISYLSNALLESVFGLSLAASHALPLRDAICVIAFGKLGGNELNYSSDIDIVFVYDPLKTDADGYAQLDHWAKTFIQALSQSGAHGKLFRVDTQLRPYGNQGSLVGSLSFFRSYYQDAAAGWELQSWLKARAICGNLEMGKSLIRSVQSWAVSPSNRSKVEESMRDIRRQGLEKLRQENRLTSEVKLGPGGIRTIEFYVQYLQIAHGEELPELVSGNTLAVLGRLHRYRLVSHNYFELLTKSYVFLRRIEHALQLQGLQQRHELPTEPVELEKLARKMGFEERLGQTASTQFRARYRQHMLTLQELSATLFQYDVNHPDTQQESP